MSLNCMHDCVSVSEHLLECVSVHLLECVSVSVLCMSVSVHWHPAHGAPLQSLQVGEGVAWREAETCARREVRSLCF